MLQRRAGLASPSVLASLSKASLRLPIALFEIGANACDFVVDPGEFYCRLCRSAGPVVAWSGPRPFGGWLDGVRGEFHGVLKQSANVLYH